jgi:hypothetical protein
MKLTRQEDVSLYLYIRDSVIGVQYAELSEGESLTLAESGKWDMSYSEELEIHPFKRSNYNGLGR